MCFYILNPIHNESHVSHTRVEKDLVHQNLLESDVLCLLLVREMREWRYAENGNVLRIDDMGVDIVFFGYTYSLKRSVIRMSFGVVGTGIISLCLGMDSVFFYQRLSSVCFCMGVVPT